MCNKSVCDTVLVPDTILGKIDTAVILADYFTTRIYVDTITDDSSFLAIIRDEISQNRINIRGYSHQNLRPYALISKFENEAQDLGFQAGAYIGHGLKSNIGIMGLYRLSNARVSIFASFGTDYGRIGLLYKFRP